MTRNTIHNIMRLTPGGDQRDRDRAKAQKKQAEANKGKSQTPKEKEAYVSPPERMVDVI